ncbi:hypothetical protein [Microcoleus sp. bin38.metabat.b11b12b14.051]|uniref:hypothetical protein n=1 Tax=Microcoleus sp. bin38.metabat.b11b12b14.051 TaxID=2742709 RepID=UPI0025F0F026|nr:hypothetical protein [Microcoleus sp. bin38.metabat.b11b12b14.051]
MSQKPGFFADTSLLNQDLSEKPGFFGASLVRFASVNLGLCDRQQRIEAFSPSQITQRHLNYKLSAQKNLSNRKIYVQRLATQPI